MPTEMDGMRSSLDDPGSPYDEVKEQDRFLPIANVARIMKRGLPENAKIAKEAKETIQECVSEFISFITSEASDRCQQEKRKTINGEDILWAMQTLGFDNYAEALRVYLSRYRDAAKLERSLTSPTSPTTASAAGLTTVDGVTIKQQPSSLDGGSPPSMTPGSASPTPSVSLTAAAAAGEQQPDLAMLFQHQTMAAAAAAAAQQHTHAHFGHHTHHTHPSAALLAGHPQPGSTAPQQTAPQQTHQTHHTHHQHTSSFGSTGAHPMSSYFTGNPYNTQG